MQPGSHPSEPLGLADLVAALGIVATDYAAVFYAVGVSAVKAMLYAHFAIKKR